MLSRKTTSTTLTLSLLVVSGVTFAIAWDSGYPNIPPCPEQRKNTALPTQCMTEGLHDDCDDFPYNAANCDGGDYITTATIVMTCEFPDPPNIPDPPANRHCFSTSKKIICYLIGPCLNDIEEEFCTQDTPTTKNERYELKVQPCSPP